MSEPRNYSIRNRENRQVIVYTDEAQTPETSYPVSPRGVTTIKLNETQLAYVRQKYSNVLIIN